MSFSAFSQEDTTRYSVFLLIDNNKARSPIDVFLEDALSVEAFAATFGVERHINEKFDLIGAVSVGKVMNRDVDVANILAVTFGAKYKFNLGGAPKLKPFVAAQLGVLYADFEQSSTTDDTALTFGPGIGLEYQLNQRLKLIGRAMYNIRDNMNYRQFSIGLGLSLAKKSDRDGDGIPDHKDACPDEFGTKENKGCEAPLETEVPEDEKEQPAATDTTQQQPVDQQPVKTDTTTTKPVGDPVATDTTKTKPVEVPVVVDSDGDGVPDAEDNCPNEAGTAANGGCAPPVATPVTDPEPQGPVYTLPIETVSFTPGTDRISRKDLPLLDALAELMAEDESFKLELNGYGDRGAGAAANFELARRRAEAVKAYLISKGRSRYRFIINALGEPREAGTNGKVKIRVIE